MDENDRDRLDRFFLDAPHWDYLWLRQVELQGTSDEVQRAVAIALGYMLSSREDEQRSAVDGPFEPIMVMEDRTSAPPLAEVDADITRLWAEIADEIVSPVSQARFNDLLWAVRHQPRPDLRARAAIKAYRSLASHEWAAPEAETPENGAGADSWGSSRRARCLRRALEIARELRDIQLQAEVVEHVMEAATGSRATGAVGALLGLLESLDSLQPAQRPAELKTLVREAIDRRVGGLHASSRLYDFAAKTLGDAQERSILRDEQVRRWIEAADDSEGLSRMHYLQRASELARHHGVLLLDELRRRLDELEPGSYGLGQISVPIEIPAEELEQFFESFVRDEGWSASLRTFAIANGDPPSGDADRNEALIDELRSQAPLQFIIPTVIVTARGLPIKTASTESDLKTAAIIRQELTGIALWGSWAPEILRRVFYRHGIPSRADLTAFFSTELIGPVISERFARAVELYLEDQHDESAHLIVPRIEAVVREIARRAGVPISREAVGDETGGIAQLGALLRGLEGRLDQSWRRYLMNALVEPTGLNLRNRISHGLVECVGQPEAAILIHIACFLVLLSPKEHASPVVSQERDA